MFTPDRAVFMMRLVTGGAVIALLVLTIGPFQGAEGEVGLSDKGAHVIAFYGLTLLAFSVAPQSRRTDLALWVLALGVLIELVQGVTGRSMSLLDLLADALGVAAATAPAWVERLRHEARRNPYLSFREIAAMDRRKRRGRRSARGKIDAQKRTSVSGGWR